MTPQYAGLRALHHDDNGVRVLGFPCNQFGAQEPGSAEEIRAFVTDKYDIDFPMFAKIDVNGANRHPVFAALCEEADDEGHAGDVRWNFEKFLIHTDGNVARFKPATSPNDVL